MVHSLRVFGGIVSGIRRTEDAGSRNEHVLRDLRYRGASGNVRTELSKVPVAARINEVVVCEVVGAAGAGTSYPHGSDLHRFLSVDDVLRAKQAENRTCFADELWQGSCAGVPH